MIETKKDKVATEDFVYRVVNNAEERLEKRVGKLEGKMDKRFDKVMVHLVDIAGKFKKFGEEQTVLSGRSRRHEDRLEKLESAVFTTS
ncbi:MAG: hypothetical protein Q8P91_02630 [bacterium]|nr:hypothetical protein [bacterium]